MDDGRHLSTTAADVLHAESAQVRRTESESKRRNRLLMPSIVFLSSSSFSSRTPRFFAFRARGPLRPSIYDVLWRSKEKKDAKLDLKQPFGSSKTLTTSSRSLSTSSKQLSSSRPPRSKKKSPPPSGHRPAPQLHRPRRRPLPGRRQPAGLARRGQMAHPREPRRRGEQRQPPVAAGVPRAAAADAGPGAGPLSEEARRGAGRVRVAEGGGARCGGRERGRQRRCRPRAQARAAAEEQPSSGDGEC